MSIVPDPSRILEVGFGFWASKVLLTALDMEVFTKLDDQSLTGEELGKVLNIHPRGIFDFFDALVTLGFLYRDGDGSSGRYRNSDAPTPTRFGRCRLLRDSEESVELPSR